MINSKNKKNKNKKSNRNSREHPWCLEQRRKTVHRIPVNPLPGEHNLLARFGVMQGEVPPELSMWGSMAHSLPFPLGFALVVVGGLFRLLLLDVHLPASSCAQHRPQNRVSPTPVPHKSPCEPRFECNTERGPTR